MIGEIKTPQAHREHGNSTQAGRPYCQDLNFIPQNCEADILSIGELFCQYKRQFNYVVSLYKNFKSTSFPLLLEG